MNAPDVVFNDEVGMPGLGQWAAGTVIPINVANNTTFITSGSLLLYTKVADPMAPGGFKKGVPVPVPPCGGDGVVKDRQ